MEEERKGGIEGGEKRRGSREEGGREEGGRVWGPFTVVSACKLKVVQAPNKIFPCAGVFKGPEEVDIFIDLKGDIRPLHS